MRCKSRFISVGIFSDGIPSVTSFPSSKMNSAKIKMIIQKHINFFWEFTIFVVVLIPITVLQKFKGVIEDSLNFRPS